MQNTDVCQGYDFFDNPFSEVSFLTAVNPSSNCANIHLSAMAEGGQAEEMVLDAILQDLQHAMSYGGNQGVMPMVANTGVMPMVANTGVMPMVANTGVMPMVTNTGVMPMVTNASPQIKNAVNLNVIRNGGGQEASSTTGNFNINPDSTVDNAFLVNTTESQVSFLPNTLYVNALTTQNTLDSRVPGIYIDHQENFLEEFEASPEEYITSQSNDIETDEDADNYDDVDVISTKPRPSLREVSKSELKITLKYRSNVVECVNVDICNGFRICYDTSLGSNQSMLTFPEKEQDFFTGDTTRVRNKLYTLTKSVLTNLREGVELSIEEGVIYATRRCPAKIYCHSSQQHNGQDPVKLQRNQSIKIFDYNTFEKRLKEFYLHQIDPAGIQGSFPKPKIFFSCAQRWRPMHDRDYCMRDIGETVQPTAITDCLVTMEIVPLRAVDFIMSLPEIREVTESITMSLEVEHLQIST